MLTRTHRVRRQGQLVSFASAAPLAGTVRMVFLATRNDEAQTPPPGIALRRAGCAFVRALCRGLSIPIGNLQALDLQGHHFRCLASVKAEKAAEPRKFLAHIRASPVNVVDLSFVRKSPCAELLVVRNPHGCKLLLVRGPQGLQFLGRAWRNSLAVGLLLCHFWRGSRALLGDLAKQWKKEKMKEERKKGRKKEGEKDRKKGRK